MPHRNDVYIDGIKAPSVTTVLNVVNKPFLHIWYGKLGLAKAQAVLKESQELGQNVHEMIEAYLKGDEIPECSGNESRMFMEFKNWAQKTAPTVVELELDMTSQKHKFYGTCDAVLEIDGKLVICDWKTSSSIDKFHGVQLAAYAQMYKEITDREITEGLIVRLDKKEGAKKLIEVKKFQNLDKYFEIFLHCLAIYNFDSGKDKF